jgi:hypothetical protein
MHIERKLAQLLTFLHLNGSSLQNDSQTQQANAGKGDVHPEPYVFFYVHAKRNGLVGWLFSSFVFLERLDGNITLH